MRAPTTLLTVFLTLGCTEIATGVQTDATIDTARDATPIDAAADSVTTDVSVERPVIDQRDATPFAVPDWQVALLAQGVTDEVLPAIDDGLFNAPVEAGAYNVDWYPPDPGTDGQLTPSAQRGVVYATARIAAPPGRRLFARADTALALYVDRAVLPGDVYASGKIRVPLPVTEAGSTVVVRSVATRGALRVQVFQTPDEIYFNTDDMTLPDLAVGEREERFVGVATLNLTDAAATDVRCRVEASDDWEATELELPSLPAGAVTQVPFRLAPRRAPTAAGQMIPVTLRIDSPTLRARYRRTINVATVAADATRRVTFRSRVDRSAQYYGLVPPSGFDATQRYGLALTLHGAGVEAIGQARAYSPKADMFVVAPTNRRPFGFDWEQWGRLDAIEILDLAMARYPVDPTRVYLTGHSMGGHGTWQLGVHDTGRFAAIGPSAGWGSFQSYTGAAAPRGAFARSQASSNTQGYLSNLSRRGVYAIHGTADDNVPIREMRALTTAVREFTSDVVTHEEPGAGHWWDGDRSPGADCVDWPPLFEFFRAHRADPTDPAFAFISPGVWVNPRRSFLTLRSATDATMDLRVTSTRSGSSVALTTANVRSMNVDGHALRAAGVTSLSVDGRDVALTDGPVAVGPQEGKRPGANGPFSEALQQPFCFVYSDGGDESWRRYAAWLVSTWAVQGNGYGCALPLSAVTPAIRAAHAIVYLGVNVTTVAPTVPADWNSRVITFNGMSFSPAVIALVFPVGGGLSGVIAATAGADRLLYRFMPFTSQFVPPDALVYDRTGVRVGGFFDGAWQNFRAL